jgi:hypothetical protein
VLRVWTLADPPVLEDAADHGGCVSWVELPEAIGAPGERRPALSDEEFARAAARVEERLAAVGAIS